MINIFERFDISDNYISATNDVTETLKLLKDAYYLPNIFLFTKNLFLKPRFWRQNFVLADIAEF